MERRALRLLPLFLFSIPPSLLLLSFLLSLLILSSLPCSSPLIDASTACPTWEELLPLRYGDGGGPPMDYDSAGIQTRGARAAAAAVMQASAFSLAPTFDEGSSNGADVLLQTCEWFPRLEPSVFPKRSSVDNESPVFMTCRTRRLMLHALLPARLSRRSLSMSILRDDPPTLAGIVFDRTIIPSGH